MRTCTNCQAPLFEEPACIICGKPASDVPQPAVQAPPPGRISIEQLRSRQPAGPLSSEYAMALCYLLLAVTGLAMLVWPAYRNNKEVRFHAVQSMLLTPAWLWAFTVVAMFGPEDYRDKIMVGLQVGLLFTWFFMVAISVSGKSISLPVIGYLARKEL